MQDSASDDECCLRINMRLYELSDKIVLGGINKFIKVYKIHLVVMSHPTTHKVTIRVIISGEEEKAMNGKKTHNESLPNSTTYF